MQVIESILVEINDLVPSEKQPEKVSTEKVVMNKVTISLIDAIFNDCQRIVSAHDITATPVVNKLILEFSQNLASIHDEQKEKSSKKIKDFLNDLTESEKEILKSLMK